MENVKEQNGEHQRGTEPRMQISLKNIENVEIFPSAGIICLFQQYSCNRGTLLLPISAL